MEWDGIKEDSTMPERPTYEELKKKVEDLEKRSAIRRFINEELRSSKGHNTALAEHIADGIALIQDEKIVYVNDAFASIYGYADSFQLIGMRAVDLFAPEYRQQFTDIYSALASGPAKEERFQAMGITKDKSKFWVEGHYNSIYWNDRLSVLAAARDISHSKKQEAAAKEEAERLRMSNLRLRGTVKDRSKFGSIVGKSPSMQEIYNQILEAASSDSGVVLYGESGTGKELIAQTIHDMSDRHGKAFVAVNCGAVQETIFENEFFGHRKGAYTGANSDQRGFFDRADEGTLFLDEVGELTPTMQVKLLRALEGGGYTPVGGNRAKYSDVRIITATNEDLLGKLRKGEMREDFFYRIHIVPINVPPLRERKEDIPLLTDHFLALFGDGKTKLEIPSDKMEAICNYSWPGNVRELKNVLQRYMTTRHLNLMSEPQPTNMVAAKIDASQSSITGNELPPQGYATESLSLRTALKEFEKSLIRQALEKNRWNRNRSAEMLNIPLRTLARKMKEFGLI